MITFVALQLNKKKVAFIEVARVNSTWDILVKYCAYIQSDPCRADGIPLAQVLNTLAHVVGNNDPLVFCSQRDQDTFFQLAKRHLRAHIGKRSYLLPPALSPNRQSDLTELIVTIATCNSSTAKFLSNISKKEPSA